MCWSHPSAACHAYQPVISPSLSPVCDPLSCGNGLSVFVAASTLRNRVPGFDFIGQGAQLGLLRQLEWCAVLGLPIALVWPCFAIPRVVAKPASRRDWPAVQRINARGGVLVVGCSSRKPSPDSTSGPAGPTRRFRVRGILFRHAVFHATVFGFGLGFRTGRPILPGK